MKNIYDLLVIGGGTAGTVCAIAAAREGLSVAIVEENNYLGGMACGSGLAEMNAAGFKGTPLYEGIVGEIFDEMIHSGDAAYNFQIPMSSNKEIKIDRLRYNPEILKILLEKKCVEAGITLFYGTSLTNVSENDGYTVIIKDGKNEITLYGSYLVDASGNCEAAVKLGYETTKPKVEDLAVSTMLFRLSNINIPELQKIISEGGLAPIIADGYAKGILKGKILAFSPIPGTNDVSVNATRSKLDHEDVFSRTLGIIQARGQILEIVEFIRKKIPGMEKAYISNIAPLMGVRDCRKIVGEYQLTLEDLESMREFQDTIAIGCYPMDIHDPITNTVLWKMLPGLYKIPFRTLLPKNAKNILVVGKCICAEEKAFAAIRVMPIVMNIGESAGYAVAYAYKNKQQLSDIDGVDLKKVLIAKGINL